MQIFFIFHFEARLRLDTVIMRRVLPSSFMADSIAFFKKYNLLSSINLPLKYFCEGEGFDHNRTVRINPYIFIVHGEVSTIYGICTVRTSSCSLSWSRINDGAPLNFASILSPLRFLNLAPCKKNVSGTLVYLLKLR